MYPLKSSYFGAEQATRARAALLIMAAIWGVNFSVAKTALTTLPPLAFNALRFPMAAALLYAVLRSRGGVPTPTRRDLLLVLLLGLFGNLLYQLSFIFGLARTTAGNASLLLAITPIITALLSALVGHERVRPRVWIGVSATFAGIAVLVLGGTRETGVQRASIAGDLLMLAAALAWACYTVGSKRLVDKYGAIVVTAWTLWAGTAGLMLVGLPAMLKLDWRAISFGTWMATVYAGVLSIGVAYMLYYYGVRRIGNTRTGSYSNIVPVFALVTAWLWLGEIPKPVQILGATIIIGGVTMAQLGSQSSAPAVSPEV